MTSLPLSSPNSHFLRLLAIITLFFAAALTSYIGFLFLVSLPLVVFVLCILHGQKNVAIVFLAALGIMSVMLFFLMKTLLPLPALASFGLAGMAMAWTAKKNYTAETIILLPSLIILGAIVFYLIYGGMQLSMSPRQLMEKQIADTVDVIIKLYDRLPLSPEEISAIKDGKPKVMQLFTRIFPALCAIAVLFTTWGNALIGNKLLYQQGAALPQLSALSQWKAPNRLVWIFLAAGGLSFMPETNFRYSGINIFLIASFIYFLQGMAIVSFFFQTRNIPPFFRWVFYFFIAIQQMLMIAIAILGFADIWINFRKYSRKTQTTD